MFDKKKGIYNKTKRFFLFKSQKVLKTNEKSQIVWFSVFLSTVTVEFGLRLHENNPNLPGLVACGGKMRKPVQGTQAARTKSQIRRPVGDSAE